MKFMGDLDKRTDIYSFKNGENTVGYFLTTEFIPSYLLRYLCSLKLKKIGITGFHFLDIMV